MPARLTPSAVAMLARCPLLVVKAIVWVSVSTDSTVARMVTVLLKETPARGTACRLPCAAAVPATSTTAIAANLSERIIIGVLPLETTTRRTIAIPPSRATSKRSLAEMRQHGAGDGLRPVEIGEVARIRHGL